MTKMNFRSPASSKLFDIFDDMENLVSYEEIRGAILYRIDGLLVKSIISGKPSYSLLSLTSWIKNTIARVSKQLDKEVSKVSYTKSPFHIFFYRAGTTGIVACILDENSNTGLLQIEIDRVAQIAGEVLSGKHINPVPG